MNKFSIFTIITILSLLFIVPTFMASLIKMIPANDQPGYSVDKRVSIYNERHFTQHFVSKNDNLIAIATSIKNPNLKNKKEIIFNLYEENNNLIRTVTLNGFNIGDGHFVKIIFEKIDHSRDKKYYFNLSSPDAGDEEVIEVFLIDPTEEILTYVYDDEIHPGGAPIVTFHKPDSRWITVKSIYINLLSKLLLFD